MIRLTATNLNFEREPLRAPFGFKGGFLTELWQTVALLESEAGRRGVGLGVQSVLWSDPRVFADRSEVAGNTLMLAMTAHALQRAQETPFETPIDLLERLLPAVNAYGQAITGRPDLRQTFALNALVPVDNAAWLLYAAENGMTSFDAMLPLWLKPALSHRHRRVISVPAIGYGMPLEEILQLTEAGYFLLKIKIGADPEKDGDPEKMLAWDCQRLNAIHAALKDRVIGDEPARYYLDANGRYDSKERLLRLLDSAAQSGALDRILLLEEPFPEEMTESVHDLPVRVVADESAHTDADARARIELGYGAIALKPIAKTLSMSLKIAALARDLGVPCFCADLTVNPTLLEWNKTVAARLAPLPGLDVGVIETNGAQNYRNWQTMQSYQPDNGAAWMQTAQGLFHLDDDFFAQSGGILTPGEHYLRLVTTQG